MDIKPKMSKIGRVYVDDDFLMHRIIGSNESGWITLNEDGSDEIFTESNLSMFCNPLLPSGIMNISIVDIGNNNQDVVVCLYRTADLALDIDRPFIAGRQSIVNFLAAQFATSMKEITYGLCISRLSSPPNFDMDIMLEFDKIIESRVLCLYPFDTISNIQELAQPTESFDSIINNFRLNFDKDDTKAVGSTLYEFLDNTGWQSEFNMAHGTVVLDDYVIEEDKDSKLLYPQSDKHLAYDIGKLTYVLEHHLNHRVGVLDVTEYNPRHDLCRIGSDAFILVRNYVDSPKVFIVKYVRGDNVVFVPKSQKLIASQLMSKLGLTA